MYIKRLDKGDKTTGEIYKQQRNGLEFFNNFYPGSE